MLPLPQGVAQGTRRKRDRAFGLGTSAAAGDLFLPPSQPGSPARIARFPGRERSLFRLEPRELACGKKVNFIRLR